MAVAGNRGGAGGAKNIARAQRPHRPKPPGPPNFPRAVPKRPGAITPGPTQLARSLPKTPATLPRARPGPVARARAQERAYASQGRAVRKAAKRQRLQAKPYSAPGAVQAARGGKVQGKPRIRGPQPITSRPRPQEQAVIAQREPFRAAHALEVRTGDKVTHEDDGHFYKQVRRRFLPDTKVPVDPFSGKQDVKYQLSDKGMKRSGEVAKQAEVTHAAGLKVVDQLMRPSHAIAGGTRAAIKGENVGKAAARGFELKDRYLGSDVLAAAGVKNKALRAVGGFAFDVGTDPVTYLTAGTSAVAKEAAISAARAAEKQAVRAGVGEGAAQTAHRAATHAAVRAGKTPAQVAEEAKAAAETARTVAVKATGERAAKRAAQAAPAGKGVTLKFAGKRIAGKHGTRVTATAGRGAGRVVRVVPGSQRVAAGARRVVGNVAPSVRRAGVREAEHIGGRQAARQARAVQQHLEAKGEHLTSRLRRKLRPEDQQRYIDAIERDDLSRLVAPNKKAEERLKALDPKEHKRRRELAQLAHEARSKKTGAYRVGRRAGALPEAIGRAGEFLGSADLKKLRQTIRVTEPEAQARRVAQLERHELRAQGKAQVAETEAAGRARTKAAVQAERGVGRARVEQAQLTGRARVATEKVRGKEAQRVAVGRQRTTGAARLETTRARTREAGRAGISREREIGQARAAVVDARRRLRTELAKPVAKRRSVPVLEGRVRRAEDAWREARGPARRQPVEAAVPRAVEPAALVSAIRPRVTAPGPGAPFPRAAAKREARAAEGYKSRTAQTEAARGRLAAAKKIPQRGITETHGQYLRRVIDYADQHGLRLVGARARKLLATKPTDVAKGYFPREFDDRLLKQLGIAETDIRAAGARGRPGTARTVPKITAGYRRDEKRRLGVVNPERQAEGAVEYSTDVSLVTLNHMKQVGRAAGAGEFAKDMATHGRPLSRRRATETAEEWQHRVHSELGPGEAIYRLGYEGGQFKLHDVTGKLPRQRTEQEVREATPRERALAARSAGKRSGQYVILHQPTVDSLQAASERIASANDLLRGLDRATGLFKRRAVASLAFHVRNAIGDILQHYTASGTHAWRVGTNVRQGYVAARRASQMSRLARPGETERTVTVAGKKTPVDDFVRQATKDGVVDTGFVGRELRTLGATSAERVKRVRGEAPKALREVPGAKGATQAASAAGRFLEGLATNRENMTRLATYKAGLDRGLTRREAADLANRIHIDYGDISEVERQIMRRVFPFYTWTARSIPIVAKSIVQYPGRTLALEKAREETGAAFTGEGELAQRGRMTASVQRQMPVVVKVAGQPVALSFSAPQTLLNEMPTGLDSKSLGAWLDENRRFWFGMVNPIIRGPGIELPTGVNVVTRREIEKKDRPLVAAPAWANSPAVPAKLKKALDVTPNFIDPKTGKKTLGWRGRADWGYDQILLGWQGQVATVLGAGRAPTATLGTGLAALGGLRADPLGAQAQKVAGEQRTYDELNRITRRVGILNQQGIHADNATPEYRRLLDRKNVLQKGLKGKPAKVKRPVSPLRGAPSRGGAVSPLTGGGASGEFGALR